MTAAGNDSKSDLDPRNGRSSVNIQFLDEDNLPLVHVMEHPVSVDEFYSDESGSCQEDSDEPTTDKVTDEELNEDIEEQDCSEKISSRDDRIQEELGITVGSENLQSCLDFFSLFITEEVYGSCWSNKLIYMQNRKGALENLQCGIQSQQMK